MIVLTNTRFSGVGATGGILVCNLFLDRIYIMLSKRSSTSSTPSQTAKSKPHPEHRLPLTILASLLLPLIILLYGLAPSTHMPVSVLLAAVCFLGFALLLISAPLAAYIVDAFGVYAASAMTMVLLTRCTMGTLLPLAIPLLTRGLGLGGAFALLAGVCLLAVPLPGVVMHFGGVWRGRSRFTREA